VEKGEDDEVKGGRMMRKLLFSAVGSSVFVFPRMACAQGVPGNRPWHHMMDWNAMRGGGIVMWILLILVIGVVIYLLVGQAKQQRPRHERTPTPLDILKTRYAKGEISKEEYEQMKQDLEE
jgi:putative membrane protein